MNKQTLVEKFNEEYIKATRTSDPQHHHQSALIAHQLVDLLGTEGVVVDNFDEELVAKRVDQLSNRKKKDFKSKLLALKTENKGRRPRTELVNPVTSPRVDDVFHHGIQWLETLSGDKINMEDEMVVELDFDRMEIKVSDLLDNLSETNLYTVIRKCNIKEITRLHQQLGLMIEEFWEDQNV